MIATVRPGIWDDPEFVSLTDLEKLIWLYLLTGPEGTVGCPGLIVMSTAHLAEALRKSTTDISAALDHLEHELKWIERDQPRRLIRVPNAPAEQGPVNGKVLKGWYRRWNAAPACDLKFAHIQSMRACAPYGNPEDSSSWRETFGSVLVVTKKPEANTSSQLLLVASSEEKSSGKAIPGPVPENPEGNEKSSGKDIPSLSIGAEAERERERERLAEAEAEAEAGDVSPRAARQEYSRDGSSMTRRRGTADGSEPLLEHGKTENQDALRQSPRLGQAPRLDDCAATSADLWERLQERRVVVGLERQAAGPHHLAMVAGLLTGAGGGPYTADQLAHAVDAAGVRAQENDKLEWLLNGVDTWSPRVIDRNLGMRTKPRDASEPGTRGTDLAAYVAKNYSGKN